MASYDITSNTNSDIEMYIYNFQAKEMFQVVVEEPVVWTTEQQGSPAKLEFTVLKFTDGDKLSFQEGNIVIFKYKGEEVFRGRIFSKQRDKDHHIACVAYDSLRYFKNKMNPRVYNMHTGTTTTKILETLCSSKENSFLKGEFDDTEVNVVWNEVSPQTLFDIIKKAEDKTLESLKNHRVYTLYDKGGKLYYHAQDKMKLDFYIDETTLENFSYKSSIDDDTYNRVLLYWGDDEGKTTKKKKTTSEERMPAGLYAYPKQDSDNPNIEAWGVLQYTEKIDSTVSDYKDKAKKLLEYYNQKTRELTLEGVFGDTRVRAGTSVVIDLNLGDIAPKKYVFVLKARHTFEHKHHSMDLDVELKIPTTGAV